MIDHRFGIAQTTTVCWSWSLLWNFFQCSFFNKKKLNIWDVSISLPWKRNWKCSSDIFVHIRAQCTGERVRSRRAGPRNRQYIYNFPWFRSILACDFSILFLFLNLNWVFLPRKIRNCHKGQSKLKPKITFLKNSWKINYFYIFLMILPNKFVFLKNQWIQIWSNLCKCDDFYM